MDETGQSTLLPDGLDPQEFLARYWQKKRLLVRQAASRGLPQISVETIRSLACTEDVSSRLVSGSAPSSDWKLRRGPFSPDQLDRLPGSGWTLLLQEVDRYLPQFADLLDSFRFLPNWRIDDAMVSYAVDGGGVGPHIDRYDVFLLQLEGRRRWRIDSTPSSEPELLPGSEMPVLAEFEHDEEWVLEPGDMLYLPPSIAHEGVAMGECISCSIGFRVPDPRELCAGYLRQLGPRVFEEIRYADPGAKLPQHLGEIPVDARRKLRESAQQLFNDEGAFDRWVGCFVTTPQRGMPRSDAAAVRSVAQLLALLDSGNTLVRSAPSHFAWYRDPSGVVQLFVGGENYSLGADRATDAELLCGKQSLNAATLLPWLRREPHCGILIDLIQRGFLSLRWEESHGGAQVAGA